MFDHVSKLLKIWPCVPIIIYVHSYTYFLIFYPCNIKTISMSTFYFYFSNYCLCNDLFLIIFLFITWRMCVCVSECLKNLELLTVSIFPSQSQTQAHTRTNTLSLSFPLSISSSPFPSRGMHRAHLCKMLCQIIFLHIFLPKIAFNYWKQPFS